MARIKIEDLSTELSQQQLDTVHGGYYSLGSTFTSFTFGPTPIAAGCGCMGMSQDPGMIGISPLAAGCGCMGMSQDPGMIAKF